MDPIKPPAPNPNQEENIFDHSKWIWPEELHWDLHNCYAQFRKTFVLDKIPEQALLAITADQSYQLYLNGRYVCRGPARGYQSHWPYDQIDVREYLQGGRNVLAIRAYNPGFSNFQYLTQGYAGLLVAAEWDGLVIVTDETWKCRRQTGLNRDAVPTSMQLFGQEHIDLRIEDPRWFEVDCDDSDWTSRVATAPWNAMPWHRLEPRGIPMLEEIEISPTIALGISEGVSAAGYQNARDVSRLFFDEGLEISRQSFSAREVVVLPSAAGAFRRILIDFERTVVGSLGLDISGARGGEIIDSLHVETVDPETLAPLYQPATTCHMAFSHRMICREGLNQHFFYHSFGFRYLVISVRDSMTTLTIRPTLRTTYYPLQISGKFESSDAELEAIWQTCTWTQRVCSMDAFVDTPWREQAQWWGDARVQAWNTFHLSGDNRLFRRGIAQIAGQTTPEGMTYGHAPTMAHGCILPDFSLVWILTLWDDYWQTGSTEAFRAHEDVVRGILDYFRHSLNPQNRLARFDSRYWLFLDWTELQRKGCPTVLNLWLLVVLDKLVLLYAVEEKPEKVEELTEWAAELRGALGALIDDRGLIHDGFADDGSLVPETSIHSQTLAIVACLDSSLEHRMLDQILLPFIRGEEPQLAGVARPSAYWITYLFAVLQERGFQSEVLSCIRQNWMPMVQHGTTWENFRPKVGEESFSHAWSAHPLYHLMQILGGVTQTAPAWKSIRFSPFFYGDSADVTIPTPQGLIRSHWRRFESRIEIGLELPKDTSALVMIPGMGEEIAIGSTTWRLSV